jgi:hypothetical protein
MVGSKSWTWFYDSWEKLFIQDTDEATAKQREVVEAAEEAVKEAVPATVPAKETTHDDQVKVPQESMQNGATHTTVTKSSDEDANGSGKAPVVPETATPPTHLPNSGEDKVTAPVQDGWKWVSWKGTTVCWAR